MVGSVQLPQDLLKIEAEIKYNPDLLRKFLTDILLKQQELEDRIAALETP